MLKALTGDPAERQGGSGKRSSSIAAPGAERYALFTLAQLGEIAWALGDLDAALAGYGEVVALLRKAPLTKVMLGLCLSNLAGVHTERGELSMPRWRPHARACRC